MKPIERRSQLVPLLRQIFVVSGVALNTLDVGCIHGYPAVLFAQILSNTPGHQRDAKYLRNGSYLSNSSYINDGSYLNNSSFINDGSYLSNSSFINDGSYLSNDSNDSFLNNESYPRNRSFHQVSSSYPSNTNSKPVDAGLRISDIDASWIASIMGITGIIGHFLSPVLMKNYGRQKTHLFSTIPSLLGWAAFVIAGSLKTLLVARLLHGLAMGLRTPLSAILVAEYTDPEFRGAFLGTFAISVGLGILLTHLAGAYCTWKMTALASSVFTLISVVIIGLSPESPSWLAAIGEFDKCRKAFRWLRGKSEEDDKELENLITSQEIQIKATYKEKNKRKKFRELMSNTFSIFRKKEFYNPAIVSVCMFFMYEFGGAHIIPAYAHRILIEILGEKSNDVNWQITAVDVLRMLSGLLGIFLVKTLNRKTVLFASGALTVISFIFISTYMYARKYNVITSSTLDSFLPICLVLLYVLSFFSGLMPLTWVISGEIFPLAYRSLGSTLATASLTPLFMLSMVTVPYLFNTMGVEGAYLLYAASLVVCLAIVLKLLPETKGRTLGEIEDSFKGVSDSIHVKGVEMEEMLKK